MSSFNFGAKEFIPSFAKPKAAAAPAVAPVAVPAPAASPPPKVAPVPAVVASSDDPSPPPRPPQKALSNTAVEYVPKAATSRKAELPWKPPVDAVVTPETKPAPVPNTHVPAFPDVGAAPAATTEATSAASKLHFEAAPFVPKFLTTTTKNGEKASASSAATSTKPSSKADKKAQLSAPVPLAASPASRPSPSLVPQPHATKPPALTPSASATTSVARTQSSPANAASPSTPTQAAPNAALAFLHKWRLYFIDRQSDSFEPYLVFEIGSIDTFWRTFNNIPAPSINPSGSTYFLFRDSVEPKWEDDANKDGGAYSVTFKPHDPSKVLDEVWIRLCCRAVGESWHEEHREYVTGVLVKVREKRTVVQVWTSAKLDFFQRDMLEAISDVMPTAFIDFASHEEAQKRAESVDATKKPVKRK